MPWLARIVAAWMLSLYGGVPDGLPQDVPEADSCDSVDLVASKAYNPSTWFDADVQLADSLTFTIPASLPVTDGNAGNHTASLSFTDGSAATVTCTWVGGSSQAHPSSPDQIDLGLFYQFSSCDNGQLAGELATADHLVLSVHNGDSLLPRTEVAITLADATCTLGPGPCADDGWGGITWLGQTVHVRTDGDDSAAGTEGEPVATLDRALEITRDWGSVGPKAIAVGPGTFEAGLLLDEPEDDGTWVMGCSPDETVLVPDDPDDPILDLAMNGELGVRGVTLDGGDVGLAMRDGALAFADDVVVASSGVVGIELEDLATVAALHEVTVVDPAADTGCGWGVSASDASVMMAGVTVLGATEAGIVVSDGQLVGFDVAVEETWPRDDGMLGRGLHTQDAWTFLYGGQFVDNTDAGLFLLDPGGAFVNGIVIDFTGAGILRGPGTTGDGLVVVGDLSAVPLFLVDNVVDHSDRAGILVEDADVFVQGNSGSFNALGNLWSGAQAFQQGGVAIGPQAPQVLDLSASPVEVYRDPLSCP